MIQEILSSVQEQIIANQAFNKQIEAEIEPLRRKREDIQLQLDEIDEEIHELATRKKLYPSWEEKVLTPIVMEISKHLNKKHKIFGSFGKRKQVTVYFLDDDSVEIIKQETLKIRLVPANVECGLIHYETGESTNGLPEDHPSNLDGENQITAPLPTTIEEIIPLLKQG